MTHKEKIAKANWAKRGKTIKTIEDKRCKNRVDPATSKIYCPMHAQLLEGTQVKALKGRPARARVIKGKGRCVQAAAAPLLPMSSPAFGIGAAAPNPNPYFSAV